VKRGHHRAAIVCANLSARSDRPDSEESTHLGNGRASRMLPTVTVTAWQFCDASRPVFFALRYRFWPLSEPGTSSIGIWTNAASHAATSPAGCGPGPSNLSSARMCRRFQWEASSMFCCCWCGLIVRARYPVSRGVV